MYYSQDGQDRYLDEKIFKRKTNGYFIEIGANDGIKFSNTYFLEKNRGWTGICIEPHPFAFEKLKKNRTAIAINACVADSENETDYLQIEGYGEMLSGLINKYDDRHIKRIERDLKIHGGSRQIVKVPCLRLDSIIVQNNVTHVDYCSIDTEGGELDILRTIDLTQHDISLISVENNYYLKELKKFMKDLKYKLIGRVGADEFYKKQKSSGWFFNR